MTSIASESTTSFPGLFFSQLEGAINDNMVESIAKGVASRVVILGEIIIEEYMVDEDVS